MADWGECLRFRTLTKKVGYGPSLQHRIYRAAGPGPGWTTSSLRKVVCHSRFQSSAESKHDSSHLQSTSIQSTSALTCTPFVVSVNALSGWALTG